MDKLIELIKSNPFDIIEKLNEEEFEKILLKADDAFFNSDNPIFSDSIYDILKDYMKFKFPKNKTQTM